MAFSPIFEQFVDASPAGVLARGIVERTFSPEKIDAIFERHAQRQYVRTLLFSLVFDLMAQVVLRLRKSLHAAYRLLTATAGVTLKAIYEKIGRLEPDVSAALVRETAAEMREAILKIKGGLPPLLPGYCVRILDGNCLAGSEHRILELRDVQAAALPGKTLAILDQETGLVVDLVPCEDGHAQERSLLDQVLAKVEKGQVWVADRNFCTMAFLASLDRAGVRFIIRQHKNLPYRTVGRRRQVEGGRTGRRVYEQDAITWDADGEPVFLRRVTVVLAEPTRDGEGEIHLLTNLPKEAAGAALVARIYAARWTLETAFQKLTDTLRCEVETLGMPKAALFAFAVAVAAYNVVATVEASLRAVHGAEKVTGEVSTYHLLNEINELQGALERLVPASDWERIQNFTPSEFARFLVRLARQVDIDVLQKAKRGPKKPPTPKTKYKHTPHVSTARLLATIRSTTT